MTTCIPISRAWASTTMMHSPWTSSCQPVVASCKNWVNLVNGAVFTYDSEAIQWAVHCSPCWRSTEAIFDTKLTGMYTRLEAFHSSDHPLDASIHLKSTKIMEQFRVDCRRLVQDTVQLQRCSCDASGCSQADEDIQRKVYPHLKHSLCVGYTRLSCHCTQDVDVKQECCRCLVP